MSADHTARRWHGIGAIVPTPFRAGGIDTAALRDITCRLVDAGVHMVWPLGAGGEQPDLDRDQRRQVVVTVVAAVDGAVPVVTGIGDCATAAVLRNLADAVAAGADAVQVAEPYYYPLRLRELVDHYTTVADTSPLPVFVYHHPSRWPAGALEHRNLAQGLGRLASHPRIVGVKDSVQDFRAHERVLFTLRDPNFAVLVSAGRLLMASLLAGSDGGVFHEAAVAPELYVRLYEATVGGKLDEALTLQRRLFHLGDAMAACDHAGAKAALALLGCCTPDLAPPLATMSAHDLSYLREVMNDLQLLATADPT